MILEQIKNPDFFNNSEQNMIYFLQNNTCPILTAPAV